MKLLLFRLSKWWKKRQKNKLNKRSRRMRRRKKNLIKRLLIRCSTCLFLNLTGHWLFLRTTSLGMLYALGIFRLKSATRSTLGLWKTKKPSSRKCFFKRQNTPKFFCNQLSRWSTPHTKLMSQKLKKLFTAIAKTRATPRTQYLCFAMEARISAPTTGGSTTTVMKNWARRVKSILILSRSSSARIADWEWRILRPMPNFIRKKKTILKRRSLRTENLRRITWRRAMWVRYPKWKATKT